MLVRLRLIGTFPNAAEQENHRGRSFPLSERSLQTNTWTSLRHARHQARLNLHIKDARYLVSLAVSCYTTRANWLHPCTPTATALMSNHWRGSNNRSSDVPLVQKTKTAACWRATMRVLSRQESKCTVE